MIQKIIIGVLLVSVVSLGYAVTIKPKEVIVEKEKIVSVPKKFGFGSEEKRTEVLTYTESEFQQLRELGLAVIEHDEKRTDTITKKNLIKIRVTAVMELKWKSRYKFGIDLNKGWDAHFENEVLHVNVPGIELLSAELIGKLHGKVVEKGWGINEKKRLKELTESLPEIIHERGIGMLKQPEIKALVTLGLEKHLRKILEIKDVEVGEISITYAG